MRFRQVHLDFHNSEAIKNIGEKFDAKEFQEALRIGHVDSITLFSKCHHGWAYHPSETNEIHPGLKFDLLGEQIKAAHEIGVKTPVYLSAGLDEKYARTHRDQVVRNKDESTTWVPDFMSPGYHRICVNTPYLDYLLAQIKEVVEKYDVDGIFLDIAGVQPCYCQYCVNQLISEGKNPDDDFHVIELAERVYENYAKRVRETIDSVRKGIPVFHNGGHIRHGRRDLVFANTHLEIESLPTGGWGYDHFPVSAAYTRTLGVEYLGMTGKFHTQWGEFGGFKHPNALLYETSLSIANGAGCSIGDQLHPTGKIDMATYNLIGKAYKEVEKKESYIKDSISLADIGVLSTEAIDNYNKSKDFSSAVSTTIGKSNSGCARILLEGKYLFNYVDLEEDFNKYKVIILPDSIIVDDFISTKLKNYTDQGGKILASGLSGTNCDGQFELDFGCEFEGMNEYIPSYIRPRFEIDSISGSAYVVYSQGYKIKEIDCEVLCDCENPYFNRTVEHFCSHQHTPNNPDDSHPVVVMGKSGIYVGYNIFEEYAQKGSLVIKEIVCKLLDRLIENKTVETSLPAQGVIQLAKQKDKYILHLLYASPVKRGTSIEIIEDIIPIYNTSVSVRLEEKPKRIYLAPQNEDVAFKYEDGIAKMQVSVINCHQMVAIEY